MLASLTCARVHSFDERYACYNDVPGYGPTPPVGSCQGCITGSPSTCFSEKPGPQCSSCDPSTKPYCQQCCPRNFTEQHYEVTTLFLRVVVKALGVRGGFSKILAHAPLSLVLFSLWLCLLLSTERGRITQRSTRRIRPCCWDNAQPQTPQPTCAQPEIITTRWSLMASRVRLSESTLWMNLVTASATRMRCALPCVLPTSFPRRKRASDDTLDLRFACAFHALDLHLAYAWLLLFFQTYSSGSPFANLCSEPSWEPTDCGEPNGYCCLHHVQGFGAFVEPEAMFVLNVTKNF